LALRVKHPVINKKNKKIQEKERVFKMIGKKEFVAKLSENLDTTKKNAKEIFDGFIFTMAQYLEDGEGISLMGVGSLKPITQAARNARNPRTGEKVMVPEKSAIKWKTSSTLKKAINS
jgi:DNA-binding protein HU-beta